MADLPSFGSLFTGPSSAGLGLPFGTDGTPGGSFALGMPFGTSTGAPGFGPLLTAREFDPRTRSTRMWSFRLGRHQGRRVGWNKYCKQIYSLFWIDRDPMVDSNFFKEDDVHLVYDINMINFELRVNSHMYKTVDDVQRSFSFKGVIKSVSGMDASGDDHFNMQGMISGDTSVGAVIGGQVQTFNLFGNVRNGTPLYLIYRWNPNPSPLFATPEGSIVDAEGLRDDAGVVVDPVDVSRRPGDRMGMMGDRIAPISMTAGHWEVIPYADPFGGSPSSNLVDWNDPVTLGRKEGALLHIGHCYKRNDSELATFGAIERALTGSAHLPGLPLMEVHLLG